MKKLALFVALCSVVTAAFAGCPGGVCKRTDREQITQGVAYPYGNGYYGTKTVEAKEEKAPRGVAYPVNEDAYEGKGGYFGPEEPAE